ncbi:CoA-transferase family III [Terfezia boudieri ATCC MYA-4762]|uniref:CoA-transferase family III n=1 Tax=Terfezia boudieri ATCC MYA-4762 TaxID=1051890 RepID=A0A3N4LPJ3_9PEZI|nr:CoA-transferase family III [Terfezia boudieri ATCC MYA-4762]
MIHLCGPSLKPRVLRPIANPNSPFAGLLLADYGASVLRIDRPSHGAANPRTNDLLTRHKSSLCIDLKSPSSIQLLENLLREGKIDILIDPFRPGVLEKLGLGPEVCLQLNPRLIYARITGFRRAGKYSMMAGHDINYLSVGGGLSAMGRKGEAPYAPLNVIGDFAGGGAMLVMGILLALLVRNKTGKGQVVEANMVDGASYLFTYPRLNGAGGGGWGRKSLIWAGPRGTNLLDGGSPFYDTYETKDGEYMAVGCLEPQFYDDFIKLLQLKGPVPNRLSKKNWPELRNLFTDKFKSKSRKEWEQIFDGTDACVTPVKSFAELEAEDQEGFTKAPVELKDSPGKNAIAEIGLRPGQGGEGVLTEWCGWVKGREFGIKNSVCQAKEPKAKL